MVLECGKIEIDASLEMWENLRMMPLFKCGKIGYVPLLENVGQLIMMLHFIYVGHLRLMPFL